MMIGRRSFIAAAAVTPLLWRAGGAAASEIDTSDLSDITGGAKPIGREERAARIARAQRLMRANGIGSVLIEPGSSMIYFSGVEWWRSERLTALVLPVEGDPCIVTPFFEAPSVRESLGIEADIRVWQEDQDPLKLVAGFLKERGLANRPIGIEQTVRYFAVNGLQHALPDADIVSAARVVRAVRMRKTPAEIALMQLATDVTIAAYRWTYPRVEAGMTAQQVSAMMSAATRKLGGSVEFSMVLLNEASAYPHGSKQPQRVADGGVVLMDCGCTVQGYQSDVSRTWVHGTASTEQRKIWDTVHQGQQIAFQAATLGSPAGSIDDKVRAYYESLGYGPGYALPGLSHRTGHGIGLDGHEPVNLVHGEDEPLDIGMCFSDEPGIYLPGKFGVRLEDCFHMTEAGPKFFSEPPPSLDQPMG
ncbi:M24 family metallopeptidase [Stakelama marina]|uniref:Aminopeptidase P family protein n=1 Tax=Stakelama marina TaxID=2826939 RepID=A0A8T4IAZ4_9SPHN|nr:Xaa-Pro peptidase family protein [Stakelama marina]MBR0551561.1 aminopeptidase P family protein [Stakelama marina]